MIAQNAQENIFIVGKVGHSLDQIDMRMFRALTRSVFRPTPHDNLTNLVQDAVSLFKVPPHCVTISTHEWYRRVLRSDSHSSVCTMVAGLEMDGIIPSSSHAKALLATVLSLLRLATAQERQQL
jgi:hypothetical protein